MLKERSDLGEGLPTHRLHGHFKNKEALMHEEGFQKLRETLIPLAIWRPHNSHQVPHDRREQSTRDSKNRLEHCKNANQVQFWGFPQPMSSFAPSRKLLAMHIHAVTSSAWPSSKTSRNHISTAYSIHPASEKQPVWRSSALTTWWGLGGQRPTIN